MTDADRRRGAWRRGEGPTPSDIDIYTDFGRRPITPERAAEIAQVRKDYEERLRREAKDRQRR